MATASFVIICRAYLYYKTTEVLRAMIRNHYLLTMNLNTIYQNQSHENKNTTFSSTRIADLMEAYKLANIVFENVSIDWPSRIYVTEMKWMLQRLSVSKILLTKWNIKFDLRKFDRGWCINISFINDMCRKCFYIGTQSSDRVAMKCFGARLSQND